MTSHSDKLVQGALLWTSAKYSDEGMRRMLNVIYICSSDKTHCSNDHLVWLSEYVKDLCTYIHIKGFSYCCTYVHTYAL